MPRQGDTDYKNKDFTDYFLLFLNNGREKEFFVAFDDLIENAKTIEEAFPEIFENENILKKEYKDEEYEDINFYEAIKEKYINKNISFKSIVRGEAAKPYIYPYRIRITCKMTRGDMCAMCGLFLTGGNLEITLDKINTLELIDCKEEQKVSLIKRKIGIMQCGQFTIEPIEQRYIQELFLSPMVTDVTSRINPEIDDKKEQRFIVRHAFSEGSEIIPNREYKFFCIPTTSPKNQTLVYYIKKAIEEESDLDNFRLSEKDKENLKIFQPETKDGILQIQEKLDDIYNDFSVNLSPVIRFRNDIMFSIDLCFHSVLNFWFGNSFERGYVENLIVGDTQVGKTKIATKLIRHYNHGVIQGAENSTVAGLIGGMSKFESINIMTWGLLPLNNSKLVILDEMSGISKDVFRELTRIRSEGIAERTVVGGSSSTHAKVRLLWLSNPLKRSMKLYDSGCDMIRELIGNEEDISRFDFILTVSGDEISSDKINTKVSAGMYNNIEHKYKSELCNKLISWIWSRKSNDVKFDKNVEDLILEYSKEMSKRFTSNFPLVLGSTIRLKIAKLSIALAARLYSTEDGETIFVNEDHVDYIFEFLNRIYNKPSFGYGEYSDFFRTGEDQSQNSKNELLNSIVTYTKDAKSFIINMLTNRRITALEIMDFAKCSKDNSERLRTVLVSNGFLLKRSGFYVKSDIFTKILKEEIKKYE